MGASFKGSPPMPSELSIPITYDAFQRYRAVAELNERQSRLLLGWFSDALGHGGQKRVSQAFEVGINTVRVGRSELLGETPSADAGRVRRPGAGRKSTEVAQPGLREAIQRALEGNSYGAPERVLFWSTLSLRGIGDIVKSQGFNVSHVTVGRIISELGYSKQLNQKLLQVGEPHPDRDKQFHFIESTVKQYLAEGLPVISVDCKKKELLGNFKNNGREYRKGDPRAVLDHDFALSDLGKVAPYGIYVLNDNTGFVNLTKCSDTSEFAAQSIRAWWMQIGKVNFPEAKKLLITCDGGGSNGYRVRLCKEQLAQLAQETGLEIMVCHFPPGTSKWNKIEHRLFCYISRSWEGKPLLDIQAVVNYISNTTTKTGLKVNCRVDERICEKGIKVTDETMATLDLEPMGRFGQWNYKVRGFLSSPSKI